MLKNMLRIYVKMLRIYVSKNMLRIYVKKLRIYVKTYEKVWTKVCQHFCVKNQLTNEEFMPKSSKTNRDFAHNSPLKTRKLRQQLMGSPFVTT